MEVRTSTIEHFRSIFQPSCRESSRLSSSKFLSVRLWKSKQSAGRCCRSGTDLGSRSFFGIGSGGSGGSKLVIKGNGRLWELGKLEGGRTHGIEGRISSAAAAASGLTYETSSGLSISERLTAEDCGTDVDLEGHSQGARGVAELKSGQGGRNCIGVHQNRGRFEVRLVRNDVLHTLVFSSEGEAARAYDKAAYKLAGASAETNFELSDEERAQVREMGWEDLLLDIQFQDFSRTSPPHVGFLGVSYKSREKAWLVTVRHENQPYVGLYPSIAEATKVYDLAAYKLQGRNALLSRPLLSGERLELIDTEWETLAVNLGLRARTPRKRNTSDCCGVRLRSSGQWMASFNHKGYYFYLGKFDSKIAAAKAYDLFAYKVHGEKARVNSELLPEEKEFLSTVSVFGLRNHLASQATVAPKILHLGARGARLVQGQWEVYLESPRKDRIYTSTVPTEREAMKVHDLAVHKLHNGMGRTYADLSNSESQEVESTDWNSLVSKFDFRQMPSYHGVKRLISGFWQSYVRHGGAYLAIATFESAQIAAQSSDKCEYKLKGKNAILNFPLSKQEMRVVDALDWGALIASIRIEQNPSPVLTELGDISAISSLDISRDKKWMLLLCHEQLLNQQMTRRAPKPARQMVVANPALASQFSHFNRRADGSPMHVEEVMEGSNSQLLWECECGNLLLKSPMGLLKTTQVLCKQAGCTVIRRTPIRIPRRKRAQNVSYSHPNQGEVIEKSTR